MWICTCFSPSVIITSFSRTRHRFFSLLLISFWIRASRAALMAESRMLFSATCSTIFSGLSPCRDRKTMTGRGDEIKTEVKANQSKAEKIRWYVDNLVHKEGSDVSRIRLIVKPEQFNSLGLSFCTRPAFVPFFRLNGASGLRSICQKKPNINILFTGFGSFITRKATKRLWLTSTSRMVHLDVGPSGSSWRRDVPPPLTLFGLLHLLVIVVSWRYEKWTLVLCSVINHNFKYCQKVQKVFTAVVHSAERSYQNNS